VKYNAIARGGEFGNEAARCCSERGRIPYAASENDLPRRQNPNVRDAQQAVGVVIGRVQNPAIGRESREEASGPDETFEIRFVDQRIEEGEVR
jgi:hypothetical protein